MSLDPNMAALAARTASAWRAEQDQPWVVFHGCGNYLLTEDGTRIAGFATAAQARAMSATGRVVLRACLECRTHADEHHGCDCGAVSARPDQRSDALPLVTAATAHILIPALQVLRPELVHFAGAAHRDQAALAVCQEWQLDPEASEDVLRERCLARRGGAW